MDINLTRIQYLDVADIVFVNPINIGYSRILERDE